MTPPLLEICTESVDGALAARDGGAQRVELCANLLEGGTTPSAGTIDLAVNRCGLPVHVLIRPRGGDFLYSDAELEVMRRDIEMAKHCGAAGVVVGALTAEGAVDRKRVAELLALARPLSVTFHRAFDMAREPLEALEDLIAIGADRVLTSGQERTALEGIELIGSLVRRARGRIVVLPGGGIHEGNVERIVRETGATEVHASARSPVESAMRHRNDRCSMGGESRPAEYSSLATDPARVRAIARILRGS